MERCAFLKAVHEGNGRDGQRLYLAFLNAAYTYLTDQDVLAIKAYLAKGLMEQVALARAPFAARSPRLFE